MDWGIVGTIVAGAAGIFSGVKAYSEVIEGDLGILTTMGKAHRDKSGQVKVYGPGGRWIIPWLQHMQVKHIKNNTLYKTDLFITLRNNLTYKFNAFILYNLNTEPKWLEHTYFILEDDSEFLTLQLEKALQLMLHKSEELDIKNVGVKLKKELKTVFEENGFELLEADAMLFSETQISQSLRGVDYRIDKALEYKDQLSPQILAAALGVSAYVPIQNDLQKSHILIETDLLEE